MEYHVPQFIDIEDKIFGPLTFRQFAYVSGGAGATIIFFTLLPAWIAVFLSAPFLILGLALAFYKINDRPFIYTLEHALSYYFGSKLYLWKQRPPIRVVQIEAKAPAPMPQVPAISASKLKDLAWSLNIKDRERMGVTSGNPSGFEL